MTDELKAKILTADQMDWLTVSLDGLVEDQKAAEAAWINSAGLEAQLEYLRGKVPDLAEQIDQRLAEYEEDHK